MRLITIYRHCARSRSQNSLFGGIKEPLRAARDRRNVWGLSIRTTRPEKEIILNKKNDRRKERLGCPGDGSTWNELRHQGILKGSSKVEKKVIRNSLNEKRQ